MRIARLTLTLVDVPGKSPVYPYRSSWRESYGARPLLVELTSSEGLVGWGETALPSRPPALWARSQAGLSSMQDQLLSLLADQDPLDIEPRAGHLRAAGYGDALVSGVEMALWDLKGKVTGLPLYQLLGGMFRPQVKVCACLGIRPPAEAARVAEEYIAQGFSTMKLKAGRDAAQDLATVKAIRAAVGKGIEIRIDANQAYSPPEALRLCRELEEYDLQYFEQPCRQDLLHELARLRLATKVPIAVNESIRTPLDMIRIVSEKAADYVIPDTPSAGGIAEVKKIAAIAEAAGIPMAMHCGHDLGVKTAAMAHLVASTPGFRFPSDTTVFSLESDLLIEPLPVIEGSVRVPAGAGLGVEVDRAKLDKYRAR